MGVTPIVPSQYLPLSSCQSSVRSKALEPFWRPEPVLTALLASTVRWFEDRYTVTPEWPDECYINHSFAPCGLWHLGFVFALEDLAPGTEITVDYRHLLAPGQEEDFVDAQSGQRIVGYTWRESMVHSTAQLQALFSKT